MYTIDNLWKQSKIAGCVETKKETFSMPTKAPTTKSSLIATDPIDEWVRQLQGEEFGLMDLVFLDELIAYSPLIGHAGSGE